MRKTLAIALLSVLALIGSASFARAVGGSPPSPREGSSARFVLGWNFIKPYACQGVAYSGVNYLIIYPTIGGSLYTSDIVSITLATPYCTSGGAFYVYTPDGINWTQTYLFP